MALKVLIFLAACLAMASAAAFLGPWAHGEDDGSYWPGKYPGDPTELHHGALAYGPWGHGFPFAHAYWG